MSWRTTKTPKRKTTLIKIRYKDPEGKIHVGNFFWSDRESTWIESVEPEEAVGLYEYEKDGWKVLGWKEISKREIVSSRRRSAKQAP